MQVKQFNTLFIEPLLFRFSSSMANHLGLRLLEHFTGISPNQYRAGKAFTISPNQESEIRLAIQALIAGKPIQYITGTEYFYHLAFHVTPDVLIPRPETEELTEMIIRYAKNSSGTLLDIGTGSGCIAITLQKYLKHFRVEAIDVSRKALAVAALNNSNHHTQVFFKQVDFLNEQESDRLGKYNIIVSNPPYIPITQCDKVDRTVRDYEPRIALFASDHQIFYKAIAQFAKKHLMPGGKIFLEAHQDYIEETAELFRKNYAEVIVITDISGNKRMLEITQFH